MVSVSDLILICSFLALVVTILRRRSLPPGPWKLPVIGSLHHLAFGKDSHLPQRRLRDLSTKYGPLMHLQLGQVSAVVVTSSEIASLVMKTHDVAFASRAGYMAAEILTYGYRDIAVAPYGEYWRTMKKLCVIELLSANRVRSYRHIREEEVSRVMEIVLAAAAAAAPVNLSERCTALTNAISWRAAFGSDELHHQEKVLNCMQRMVEQMSGVSIVDFYPSLQFILARLTGAHRVVWQVFGEMNGMLDELVKARLAKRAAAGKTGKAVKSSGKGGDDTEQTDLVDLLLSHYERQDLGFQISLNDIKAVLQEMFLGATDTTATTIEWALAELYTHPKALAKAQSEVRAVFQEQGKLDETTTDQLSYLKLVIKETLRLHPPVPISIPRECREATVIAGYKIQPKTRVIVNAWGIGRDPKYWVDADEFNPERFQDPALSSVDYKGTNFSYLPFGAGRRMCPGAAFGIAVIEITLARLLCHFDWRLTPEDEATGLNMDETFGATAGRKIPLCLIPQVRVPYN